MKSLWRYTLILLMTFCINSISAQEQQEEIFADAPILGQSRVTIRNVVISGNKITKRYIVLRELPFEIGQAYSISDVLIGLQKGRQNIMNTTLFVSASLNFTNWYNDSMDIYIDVKERWYYIALPFFRPIDRNWNVWLKDYSLSLDRVNYGLKFLGKNISGRNDRLNIWLTNGYSRRVAFNYYNPFSDKTLRHGFGFDFSYLQNKELNYTTLNNKQQFFKDDNKFLRQQLYAGLLYSYRRGSVERHYVKLGYQAESIADTVLSLNPSYYLNGKQKVSFPEIKYTYNNFDLNYIPYPTRGKVIELEFTKRGFNKNMNLWQLYFKYGRYFQLPKKMYVSSILETHLRLPFDQPFLNQPMLGYGESFLRGLEYYVIDGVAGGFVRNTIGKEIFNYKLKTSIKSKAYESIPFRFYLKLYGDAGIVYNKNNLNTNFLTNKMMYTGGVGLDIISIYDIVIRLEYSFNNLREGGFYVHKTDIKN